MSEHLNNQLPLTLRTGAKLANDLFSVSSTYMLSLQESPGDSRKSIKSHGFLMKRKIFLCDLS